MDDKQKQANEQQRYDTARHRAFKDLVNSPGWKLFVDMLNNNVGARTKDIFEPPTTVNVRSDDHNKGACYGLLWARDIVPTTIAAFNEASDPATEEEST